MKKYIFLATLFLYTIVIVKGQDVVYIDKFCRKTNKNSATYKRTIEKVDDHYIVRDYYLSGQLFMEAACVSVRSTTNTFYHGKCSYYYEDGKKYIEGFYSNNNPLKIWKYFSKDGMDSITTRFEKGHQNFVESSFSNRLKEVKDNKNNSGGISSDSLSEKSDEYLTLINTTDAEFPGGKQALEKYIQKNFHYPEEALNRRISGMVKIYFEVDKTGKVGNVRLLSKIPIGFGLEEEALRIIKDMPTMWIPATQNGKPGKQRRSIPFNYLLPEY